MSSQMSIFKKEFAKKEFASSISSNNPSSETLVAPLASVTICIFAGTLVIAVEVFDCSFLLHLF